MKEPTVLNIGDPKKFTELIKTSIEKHDGVHILAYSVGRRQKDEDADGNPVMLQPVSREYMLDSGVVAVNTAPVTVAIDYSEAMDAEGDESVVKGMAAERAAEAELVGVVESRVDGLVSSMEELGVLCVPGGYSWPGLANSSGR